MSTQVAKLISLRGNAPAASLRNSRARPTHTSSQPRHVRVCCEQESTLPRSEVEATYTRRGALQTLTLSGVALALSSASVPPEVAYAAAATPEEALQGKKVVVLGGTGFVGSQVVAQLAAKGATVVSVSRGGAAPAGAPGGVQYAAADLLSPSVDLSSVLQGATAVVSCIGVIGGSDEAQVAGNGTANEVAVAAAKAAGVTQFVYISVSSGTMDAVDGIALKGYFEGKRRAEAAVAAGFPNNAAIIKPSFIYGSEAFALSPPRVPHGYGDFVEGTLSLPPFRLAAKIGGPIGLALSPPVAVEAVAGAAVEAIVDGINYGPFEKYGVIDGTDAINKVASGDHS